MVRLLIDFFHRDVLGIHRIALLIAGSTLISQLLALLRDRLLAEEFGASAALDIYYSAFKVQDILFFFFSSFLSVSVIIPFLIERAENNEELRRFLNSVFTVFFVGVFSIGLLLFVFTPDILRILFPSLFSGFYGNEFVSLTRILLLSPILLGASSLLTSISQVNHKFYLYALSPVLYNIGIIVGILFFYPTFGLSGLGFGVIFGATMHFLVQVPFVISKGVFPKFSFFNIDPSAFSLIKLSLPRTLVLTSNYLVLLLFTAIASRMAEGSVSVLNFSMNLQSVPLALIGVSYSVAVFPVLAKHFSKGEVEQFVSNVYTAARHIIFWSVIISAFFIVLRAHIVRSVLGGGSFDWSDTRLTAAALALFAVSISFQGLSLLFIRGFYAMGKTWLPFLVVSASSLLTILLFFVGELVFNKFSFLALFFEFLLRVESVSGVGVLLLPMAFSVGSIFQASIFYYFLKKTLGAKMGLKKVFLQSLTASVVAGLVTYGIADYLGAVFGLSSFFGVLLSAVISGLFGLLFGAVILYLLKNKEFFETIESLQTRFSRKDVIISGE